MQSWPLVRPALLLVLLALACSKPDTKAEAPVPAGAKSAPSVVGATAETGASASGLRCQRQSFAESVDLAEASGATFLSDSQVLLIGDSGTKGAYALVDAKSGELLQKGVLKLDTKASDDLEGVSTMDGTVYAITSSGWMREWSHEAGAFSPKGESYPLAPLDARGLVCKSARTTNCAKNYEGLCLLRTAPTGGACAGFAAAKATGELICLVVNAEGRLALDPSRSISVASAKSLSGCDFDPEGRLWFGNNFFAANAIGFVEKWQKHDEAVLQSAGRIGLGFAEAIAAGPEGQLIRASDTSGSPSLLSKYICR